MIKIKHPYRSRLWSAGFAAFDYTTSDSINVGRLTAHCLAPYYPGATDPEPRD